MYFISNRPTEKTYPYASDHEGDIVKVRKEDHSEFGAIKHMFDNRLDWLLSIFIHKLAEFFGSQYFQISHMLQTNIFRY